MLLPAPVRAVWLWWRPFFDRLGRNRPLNATDNGHKALCPLSHAFLVSIELNNTAASLLECRERAHSVSIGAADSQPKISTALKAAQAGVTTVAILTTLAVCTLLATHSSSVPIFMAPDHVMMCDASNVSV
eukprot:COSAG03_NODE_1148_length_4710_cov_1.830622_7_plen_131_part_00